MELLFYIFSIIHDKCRFDKEILQKTSQKICLTSITLALGNNRLGQRLVELHIVAGLHGELAASLRTGAKVRRVAEHLRQRDKAVDLLRAIAQDPDYGEMICSCEEVTKAEILQAIHNPLGVSTMTGIKYRTRAMMGGCQGGFCQMKIENFIEQELGTEPEDVRYSRQGSWVLTGTMRKEEN